MSRKNLVNGQDRFGCVRRGSENDALWEGRQAVNLLNILIISEGIPCGLRRERACQSRPSSLYSLSAGSACSIVANQSNTPKSSTAAAQLWTVFPLIMSATYPATRSAGNTAWKLVLPCC